MLDTPNRKPGRPSANASDSTTTARVEVGGVRVRAIRGRRRPVVTAATLKVVRTTTPVTVASKRQTDGTASAVVGIDLIT